MRRLGAALVTAIISTYALAACSGGGSDESSPTATPKPTPSASSFTVESALRELPPIKPSPDQPLQVFASDLAQASELGQLPKPHDPQSTATWIQRLNGPKVYITGGEGLGLPRLQTGAMRKALGFDARDITTTSSVESLPDAVTVVHLADGVGSKDVSTTGNGKIGDLDPAGASDAPFPQVFGVARGGEQIALAKTQKALAAWKSRGQRSLADDKPLLDVAKALDTHRVYDVVLSDRPADAAFGGQLAEHMPATMPAFDAVGVAQAVEDGTAVEYIAYRVKDVAGAEERIKAVWENDFAIRSNVWFAEILDVEDVSTAGSVVTVKIAPKESAGTAAQMLVLGDIPFVVPD